MSKAENSTPIAQSRRRCPYQLKLYYYFTFAWLYNYWESYAQNSDYAEEFRAQKKHYMNLLLQNFNEDSRNTVYYNYLLGENVYLDEPTSKESLNHYHEGTEDVASQITHPCHVGLRYRQILQTYTANSTFTRNIS